MQNPSPSSTQLALTWYKQAYALFLLQPRLWLVFGLINCLFNLALQSMGSLIGGMVMLVLTPFFSASFLLAARAVSHGSKPSTMDFFLSFSVLYRNRLLAAAGLYIGFFITLVLVGVAALILSGNDLSTETLMQIKKMFEQIQQTGNPPDPATFSPSMTYLILVLSVIALGLSCLYTVHLFVYSLVIALMVLQNVPLFEAYKIVVRTAVKHLRACLFCLLIYVGILFLALLLSNIPFLAVLIQVLLLLLPNLLLYSVWSTFFNSSDTLDYDTQLPDVGYAE
ncbi:MAG: hypothetical protein K2P98_02835 [Neisseriaceae bacterium]|nr:hypothetical protein [Neisseriaceae bacterium]